MNRIPESQKTDADEPHTSVGVKLTERRREATSVEVGFDTKVSGHVESDGTGKNVLICEADTDDDSSELRLLDDWSPDDAESDQYDPYNSGSFDMSNSRAWKHSRK